MSTVKIGFDNQAGLLSGRDMLIQYGPTLPVRIGLDLKYQPSRAASPKLPMKQLAALVDTGATESCIDSTLARDLSLPVVDRQTVAGVHGASAVNVHIAQIYVPGLDITVYGRFAGVHLIAGGQPHSALLGRTFLRNVTMMYEGRTGAVTISNN